MKSIKVFNRDFRVSLLGVGIYLLLLVVFTSLGFWQLSRSEQKRVFIEVQQQALANPAVIDLNQQTEIDSKALRYQKVIAKGHYLPQQQFLLDNQIYQGKAGYAVLTPFVIEQNQNMVLVNRGWIPLGVNRSQLPNIELHDEIDSVRGRINQFPEPGIKLAGAEIPTANWPSVVGVLDSKLLSAKLGHTLYNFEIELDAEESAGYIRLWQTSAIMPPEKHIAYAVQWFGLALSASAWFFWQSIRKQP